MLLTSTIIFCGCEDKSTTTSPINPVSRRLSKLANLATAMPPIFYADGRSIGVSGSVILRKRMARLAEKGVIDCGVVNP